MLLSLFLFACSAPTGDPGVESCAETPPEPGMVRAKKIACSAELSEGAEAEIGDWLLENSIVRITVRDATHRLTQLDGTGGSILDVSVQGGNDAVTEIFPLFPEGWPASADVFAEDDAIVVNPSDGSMQSWRYRLSPDDGTLVVEGAEGFTMVPAHGAFRTGSIVQSTHEIPLSVGAIGAFEDEGGWIHWQNTDTLAFGNWRDVVEALFPETETAEGETDGLALQVQDADGFSYAFWIDPGPFNIPVPPSAEIRALRSGYAPSDWIPASDGMNLQVGDEGFISTLVIDDQGEPIPATLHWNNRQYALPPGPNTIGVGPGDGAGYIDAGPRFESYVIEPQTISGTQSLEVSLARTITDAALVAIDVPAFPDPKERSFTDDLLIQLAGQGYNYAILTAGDEVARASPSDNLAVSIGMQAGSRANSDAGLPIAFPWNGNRRKPAHGAAPWAELDAQDLLAFMSKSGRRQTIVDSNWVLSAGAPVNWETVPDSFMLRSYEDIATYAALLDQWIPAILVGPKTWAMTDTISDADILRAMTKGSTVATSGPLIRFTLNAEGPGANLHTDLDDLVSTPSVQIEIANAGDIDRISMIGSGGVELISWKPHNPPQHYPLSNTDWVLVAAKGHQDWAVTGPIWLSRP